ncbi:peptide/nickel transport system substrate-binding protein [Jhaorihella thermophila]|uniref:Peptide/nickel transport system substrate-binding protein n=2 Tax=Jhaorihella thermophila TaxID=488547 RepID=A0A1H5U631_9RHOB|nr:ABC transporter substrate-binding protein [Jhaorihella thermophila]SEF70460.1 peptide/nickel transport system substrate-binding protein [Jhaorihella thermophila]
MKKKLFLKQQADRLTNGQIDRRQFIMSAMAAGVVLPTAMSMADKAMAATPKKGGTLRIGSGHGSTTDSMDPGTYENGFSLGMGFMYGNCLTEVSNTGELIPELAESFESADAKTWVFKLRKGVEFHNGKTLTAEDVIATYAHHRGEESKSAAKGLLTAVTDIRADGDDTVVFELSAPNADFPYIVSDYHLIILPSKDGKVDPLAGIGTGGYVIQTFEPGVKVIGTRNPNYWKEGRAHFDEVQILSIVDVTARQNALMGGDVDLIDRVDPKTVNLLGRNPAIDILETTGTLHYTFPMRLDVPPFDNYDLRMALKLAVKRQELVDKILLGHGALGNDHPISPATSFYAPDIPQREFDRDKAMHHYKKSGHSGKIQLSTSDAAFAGAVDAAQLIAASAAECGIEIEVVREPKDGYWSNVWNKKGWCACYWGGRPTADWMFSAAYVADTEWNDTAWKDTPAAKEFNDLVVKARAELDNAKRAAMYKRCQELIRDDGGALVPMFANYIMGVSKKLMHDDAVAANWELDGGKAHERWWFG